MEASVLVVDTIVKIWIVDVYFVRVDSDEWAIVPVQLGGFPCIATVEDDIVVKLIPKGPYC